MAVIKWADLKNEVGIGILNAICEELNIPMDADMDDAKEPEKGFIAKIRSVVKEMKRLQTTSVKRAIASLASKQEVKEDDKQYNTVSSTLDQLIARRNSERNDDIQDLALAAGERQAAAVEVTRNMVATYVLATGDYKDPNLATAVQQSEEIFYGTVLGAMDGCRNTNFLDKFQSRYGIGSAPSRKAISSTPTNS